MGHLISSIHQSMRYNCPILKLYTDGHKPGASITVIQIQVRLLAELVLLVTPLQFLLS